MPSEDVEIATKFRAAVETAVSTGDRSALLEVVDPDGNGSRRSAPSGVSKS